MNPLRKDRSRLLMIVALARLGGDAIVARSGVRAEDVRPCSDSVTAGHALREFFAQHGYDVTSAPRPGRSQAGARSFSSRERSFRSGFTS